MLSTDYAMQFKHSLLTITVFFHCVCSIFAQQPIVLRPSGEVRTVKFSPVNNSLIASAGDNNTIKLWNLQDDTVRTFRGHNDQINTVAFSPNGQVLVSGSDDWTFKLWNIPQQQHIATLEHINESSRSQVKDVAFSPDGQLLATAGRHVKLWGINNQTEIATLQHDKYVWGLAFSPNGQHLAAGDRTGTVKIWNVQKHNLIARLQGDTDSVYAVAFSPDGEILAGAGYNGQVKLWAASDWTLLGTLQDRRTTYALDFSRDGKVLASTGHSVVTLWSVDSGKEIVSLKGHSGWVRGTAFSSDGKTLVSGGEDGTVRVQNIETYLQTLQQRKMVRLIYFLPNNRRAQPDIDTKLHTLIKDVQQFYARQMQSHGFGRKTFTFEKDSRENAVVHHLSGRFRDRYYHIETYDKIKKEVDKQFDTSKHLYFIAVDVSSEIINKESKSVCGVGGGQWKGIKTGTQRRDPGGHAIIPASGRCFIIDSVAHELGHAFGLKHDFRNNTHIMSYGTNRNKLSDCAAEWLDVHPYFNTSQTAFNESTTIEMLTPLAFPRNTIRLRFEVNDADGPHRAKLIVPTTPRDPTDGVKLHSCEALNSEINRIGFTTTQLRLESSTEVTLRVIDVYGNITERTYPVRGNDVARVDINRDGTVDVDDLVLVASHFGSRVARRANPNPDVNKDGLVDREDLLLVADALETAENIPAAPALATANLQRWLLEAKQHDRRDTTFQKGIAVLEQLLTPSHPVEIALLPNYPNPFNPETWIPYQLTEAADVSISIYAADGTLVRILALGHQPMGIYASRSRAAYWDGRNKLGEPVASGVYFYTLTAGNFTATRKMLIRK